MPGYIAKALHKFQHPAPKKPQYVPHAWLTPTYGQKVQYALPPETLPVIDKKGTKRVQSITVTLQYYTKDIGTTMIVAVNELAPQQSAATKRNSKTVQHADGLRTYLPQCNNPISRK